MLAGIYLVITALLARRQLVAVSEEVSQLRTQISAGDLDAARTTAGRIAEHAGSAHGYTSGPVWAVAAALPVGGTPLDTVRTITGQVDVLGGRVLPEIVTATRTLDPTTLRKPDGSLDLTRIQSIAPGLSTADATMTRAAARIAARPASTWLSPVDSARSQLVTQLRALGATVHSAELAARIAPEMLGANGVKRYFVGFQNDAEARGTGGLPGAFGIVQADHGKLSIVRFESDTELLGVSSGQDLGSDYNALWHSSTPYSQYVDSNVSAHFPYAARIWLAMWQRKTGQKLDGALALDPEALSYLLAVTGPATLPDRSVVSAGNVVALTQQVLYARYPSDGQSAERKRYLLAVARSASEKILAFRGSTTALVRAAGSAGAQRRLLVYSTTPATEAELTQTSLSGAVEATKSPYVGLVVNNDAGNKLDYYLKRQLTWERSGCGSRREVSVTIALTNGAPASVPAYVAQRNDHPAYRTARGDNRLGVFYYGTAGAFLQSATLDGKPALIGSGTEQGHPVYFADVELPRGRTRTLVLHFLEPTGTGAPTVLRQPLVQPLAVTVQDHSCG